jgi:ABC-type branched-subunit amino acid transport system ATPase component
VLEVRNIDVFYGDVQVVWDISFDVKQGEVVALIGANGAGKSTTLKTVSGLLRPRTWVRSRRTTGSTGAWRSARRRGASSSR